MDSIATLIDKKEYELVIKLTEGSSDIEELFYRITAFTALAKVYEALDCIERNKDILQKELPILMKMHIELLCAIGEFDLAFEKLDYYGNLPYFSQEAEELLKELPKYVRQEMINMNKMKDVSDEKIVKLLISSNESEVLMGLDLIKDKDINNFLTYLNKIMVSFPKQSIRTIALFVLIERSYNKIIKFNSLGKIIDINPSTCEKPFVDKQFNDLIYKINVDYKDPTLSNSAIQILSTYIINSYPKKLEYTENLLLGVLYYISGIMLQLDDQISKQEIIDKYNLNNDEFEKALDEISKLSKDI